MKKHTLQGIYFNDESEVSIVLTNARMSFAITCFIFLLIIQMKSTTKYGGPTKR